MKSNRFTCSRKFLSFWNKHVVVPATHCAEWEATAARDLSNRRAFMLSPPYSSSNKRSIGKRLHQWHKLIFLHDCHVTLTSISFFLVFCRRILKTRLKKGRGGNFSQSRERGARQEYYWALEIDVMRGSWVAYAINPGKNERKL